MNIEQIELFKSTLITTRNYSYYVDWEKVKEFVTSNEFANKINVFNELIGIKDSKKFKDKFYEIIEQSPSIVEIFPLLFALSEKDRKNLERKLFEVYDLSKNKVDSYDFTKNKLLEKKEKERYFIFFKLMGLKKLFSDFLQGNLRDYIVGVLVGLDSNARKNRSGSFFEKLCKDEINKICQKYEITLKCQADLECVSDSLKGKKADFLLWKKVDGKNKYINIEVNFFGTPGSKIDIEKVYKERNEQIKQTNNHFILITDGLGWRNMPNELINDLINSYDFFNYEIAFHKKQLEQKIINIFKLKLVQS